MPKSRKKDFFPQFFLVPFKSCKNDVPVVPTFCIPSPINNFIDFDFYSQRKQFSPFAVCIKRIVLLAAAALRNLIPGHAKVIEVLKFIFG